MSKSISISKAAYAATAKNQASWFDRQAEKFESSRFAAMTILMTAQSCLGSIAAMLVLQASAYTLLAICTAVTLVANSAFIAQVSGKWCLALFYLSLTTNIALIIASLFI